MKNLNYFLMFLMVTLIFLCSCEEKTNKVKKNNSFLKKIQQFGNPNDPTESIIGSITGFTIDKDQNVYIVDNAFKEIKLFSKDAKLIKKFGKGAGRGPGEFSFLSHITLDSLNNIYVLDKNNRNVTVFNSHNEVLYSKRLPFIPAPQIVVLKPFLIDVHGFEFTYQGNLIHRYDLTQIKRNEPVFTYCERDSGIVAKKVMRTGNVGGIAKIRGDKILFSSFYPYVIKIFSINGKLIKKIHGRELPEPQIDLASGRPGRSSGLRDFVYFPNGIMLGLVQEVDEDEKYIQYFDFLNIESGEIIKSFPCKELGLGRVKYIRNDNQGHLYISFMEPYPHIIKYKIDLDLL